MPQILIDTNVLIYAYDRSEPHKQRQALAVLDHLVGAGQGVISTQVLTEFCAVALRKLTAVLTPGQVEARVTHYTRIFTVLPVSVPVIQMGLRGVREHSLSFWDAQIWAVACLHGLPLLLSEDFNPGAVIEGVRFANPFAADFDWATLGLDTV
jgi:predicted nucleic acid-binding protein